MHTLEAESTALAVNPGPVTPISLIERAYQTGASVETLQQLFDLKLRVEADEARKAFNESMAKFKAHAPRITKNISKKAGQIDLHYASLDNVVDTIAPALSAVGIRHRWENKQDGGMIQVTCILSHDQGHSESTVLAALPDTSGAKNSIQAIASTVTYLQRYTLLGATGMAAVGTDDDGVAAGSQMPEPELVAALDSIREGRTQKEVVTLFQSAYKAAQGYGDKAAMNDLIECKNKRKAELA